MPLIVFDSYDATGKTNYARALSKRLNYSFPKKFSAQLPEFADPYEHGFWSQAQYYMMARILHGTNINMIMDRWIMTEYCYSPVLRCYTIDDYYWDIEKIISKTRNILWVYTSIDDVSNFLKIIGYRFKKNNETYVTIDQTLEIKNNYEALFEKSSIPRIRIDTSKTDKQTISDNLDKIYDAAFCLENGYKVDDGNIIKPIGEYPAVTGCARK